MKAILAAIFAVLIGLAFSTTTFAQAPATPPPAGAEMKKDEGKKVEKKEKGKVKKPKKEKKEDMKEKK